MLVFAGAPMSPSTRSYTNLADSFPFIGVAVWSAIPLTIPVRRHDWEVLPETVQRF